jgi:flagellar hook-associated protein 1 FlgK
MNTYGIGLNGSLLMGAQSLNAQQLAISTIGNNISNVNTPGYARQRVNLTDNSTIYQGAGEVGTGVSVSGIEGLRSSLLDTLVQQSLGDQGYADDQSTLTSTVQSALGEDYSSTSSSGSTGSTTSSSGAVQDAMSSFFGALQNLASTPSDTTARQTVVQDGQTLANAIGGAYQRMQDVQSQVASDAGAITTQINQLSTSIASLNQQIVQAQAASGATANDLINSRTADIESLSGLVNVTTTAESNGSVKIALADNTSVVLVDGKDGGGAGSTQSLSVAYDPTASTPLTVSGSSTGVLGAGVPSSGSLGSHLETANNLIGSPASAGDTGILGALDGVANQLRTQINAQSVKGYDLKGNAGTDFFTGTGAADLAVSASLVANPALVAAGDGSGSLDGSNALAMSEIQSSASIVPAFQSMVTNLGTTVSTAASNQTTQDQVTKQLQQQRDSVSGVSIDEEMTNLISFQQAYDASARFITTISSLYNTLVTQTT